MSIDWPGEEFLCGCHVESLRVCSTDDEVDLSIWSARNYDGRMRWRDRLRCMWKLVREGSPFADQISLDKDQTMRLALILNRIAGVWTTSNSQTQYTVTGSGNVRGQT